MSFLKNLTKEFNDLKAKFGDESEKKPEAAQEASRGEADSFYGQQHQQAPPGAHGYPPQDQGYGYGAPQQPYGAPQQQPYGQYSQGPPQPYGAPPPPQGHGGGPPCPPGWHAQWDPNSQRYYYVEQATGRTTWDLPHQGQTDYRAAPPPPGDAGLSYPPYGGQAQHGMKDLPEGEKKKKDNSMLYGVGGLAAGALVGGIVAHELTEDSDDEKQQAAAAPAADPTPQAYPPPQSYQDPSYGSDPYGAPPPQDDEPPAVLPAEDADGESVSSSDREEVQEAREDYEEALAEASSSSDQEEVEEAREEYEETYEENYGSD